ncbi:hypothetical protein JHW45_04320 [Paracoccus stylophorae]|uniref:Excalibur calcium-binding domain-containing protein n=1 Tax=Paracoccus stylophorae TaxID=659350 RepID=A0ABY7SYU5_9RHOB|nr:hypothetical protein [Paracoccus stylophorae]WCR11618.1 hypothetical protein JHW45_04320 [Paracoccus stylophorae]
MRGWLVISVLALAGCGEHQGWNPNYQFGASRYGQYLVSREVALMTRADAPQTIPIALPANAPTPEQIAGRAPVPVPATMGVRRIVTTQPATATATARVVPGTALPTTSTGSYPGSVPVLVRYAFAADHAPGTTIYRRAGGSAAQAARVCAGFANPDAAQIAFLAAGGPGRDPRGMDPDGDGFVCGWDPAPFRQSRL